MQFQRTGQFAPAFQNECRHIRDMCDIIDFYKYGIKGNTWGNLGREKLTKFHLKSVPRDKMPRFQKRSILSNGHSRDFHI